MARPAFDARIGKVGINPCVAVPVRISRALAARGYIPVKGTLNRFPIRATLVPIGGGRHRLYLNTEMRKGALSRPGGSYANTEMRKGALSRPGGSYARAGKARVQSS